MKKIIKYIFLYIICFVFSSLICFNLVNMINNMKLLWSFNLYDSLKFLSSHSSFYGTFLLSFLFILFIIKYDRDINLKSKNKNEMPSKDGSYEYGSSRFSTEKEIKKKFKVWDVNKPISKGGIPVTFIGDKVYYDDSTDHTLIIGSTGSGKSISLIMPLIFNLASAGESMVINDVKGELYSTTADYLKKHDYDIKIINLRDALTSDGWNPLHLPYKYFKEGNIDEAGDMIENFAKSLTKNLSSKDMYWEKSANAVLVALCYALFEDAQCEDEVNLYSIYNLLVEHGGKMIDRSNSLDLYFQQKPMGSLSKMSYATGSFAKGETRATLFSVLATVIKMFSDTGIANMTSRTDFELDDIGRKKTAVFLIIPDEKESRHELVTLFIHQCYQACVYMAQSLPNGKLPVRVNYVLDEFSSYYISSMPNKITVSRSRNIRFYLTIQDFHLLKDTYKESAGTIKSNCGNWIYLLTSDNDTAKEISTRIGKYTISSSRVSTSTRLEQLDYHLSNDKSLLGRDLVMPEELMRLKLGEGLFLKTRLYPIKSKLKTIDEYGIKYTKIDLPKEKKEFKIQCFDLNEYRKRKSDNLIDLE